MTSTKVYKVNTKLSSVTVYKASYRSLPWLSPPACRHQPLPPDAYSKRPRVTLETVTVHRDTYRPTKEAPNLIKSKRPRDRCGVILAGDGFYRVHNNNTSYKMDYLAKSRQPGVPILNRSNISRVPIQRPLHVPIQSETSTGAAYGQIAAAKTKLWRPPRDIYEGSPSPMETKSVYRWSYRPQKNVRIVTEDNCTCVTAAEQRDGTDDDTRKSTVPIEKCTTYTSTYGPGHGDCKNIVVNIQSDKTCSTIRHKKRP